MSADTAVHNNLVCYYSHGDQAWLDRIKGALIAKVPTISVWTVEDVPAKQHWRAEEEEILSNAKFVLLLVSPPLLRSEFFTQTVLPRILRAVQSTDIKALWVPISRFPWGRTPLASLQAVIDPNVAIDEMSPPERARALVRISEIILKSTGPAPASTSTPPAIPDRKPRERINITFDPKLTGVTNKEIPFALTVLTPLTGDETPRPHRPSGPDSLEDAFASFKPKLLLRPAKDIRLEEITLPFESLENFDPEKLSLEVPALRELVGLRSKLDQLRGLLEKNQTASANQIVKEIEVLLADQVKHPRPQAPPDESSSPQPSSGEDTVRNRRRRGKPEGRTPHVPVTVFYATDRKSSKIEGSQEKLCYSNERAPDRKLSLGSCRVSIPTTHRIGALEGPSVWKLEFKEDQKKHIVLLSVQSQRPATFFRDVAQAVNRSERKEAFVFIHGYNTSFENAARRTAQLAYDLQFEGAPILYSWPSKARLRSYIADETNVMWSVPQLTHFLRTLSASVGASTIHLIAHSMGNRALTAALEQIAAKPDLTKPLFNQVVLTAPDIDADTFRHLAIAVRKTGDRFTLYTCLKDKALVVSKRFHGYPRAGEAVVVIPGVDTIDASAVDTSLVSHSYFGTSRSVLSDIYSLFRAGEPPSHRYGMTHQESEDGIYYVFRP